MKEVNKISLSIEEVRDAVSAYLYTNFGRSLPEEIQISVDDELGQFVIEYSKTSVANNNPKEDYPSWNGR